MSSSLNLSPDITVIGIQAGLFLTNMFVVKKLMLEPYLKLRSAREAKTGGSQGDAIALVNKASELDQIIGEKMRDAHKAAAVVRETIKSAALARRSSIVGVAETSAKKEQQEIQASIAANLKEERSKRDETITKITEELVQQATH